MRKDLFFFTIFCLTVALSPSVCAQLQVNRLPINPLVSDRSDVEKIGTEVDSNPSYFVYITPLGKVHVKYSTAPCLWHGWNIPSGRVVEYDLYPTDKMTKANFEDLIAGLPLFVDDILMEHFSDSDNGIQYVFNADGTLSRVRRTASTKDNSLRCKGFPLYSVAADTYTELEQFNVDDLGRWDIGRLGGFLTDLKRNANRKGVIFVYSSKNHRKFDSTFVRFVEKVEKYAFEILGVPKRRLSISFGGTRDVIEIDVVTVPTKYPDPSPRPKYPAL